MSVSERNLRSITVILTICVISLLGYVFVFKEAMAHRANWRLSPGFSTCEQLVDYMNVEGIHTDFEIVSEKGGYRIIFDD